MGISVLTVNLILNIILIPRYGLNGAAVSTSIAYSLSAFTKLWIFKILGGVNVIQIFKLSKKDLSLIKKQVICRDKK